MAEDGRCEEVRCEGMKMGEERIITVPLIRPLTNKPIGSLILSVRNQV